MIFETRLARWQKLSGILAMIFLTAALAAFVDAMVGGLRGNSGTVELIPDSRFLISGPMPPKTEAIADFVIEGQPEDESLKLIPEAIFSGYWFGGSMWRGVIAVNPYAREGNYTIVVKDRYGEKQNPALVFSIRIWPDLATQKAHAPSFLTRKTGYSPFVFAAVFLVCGIVTGGITFLLGWLWTKHLSSRSCGEIYILRRVEQETEATCELLRPLDLKTGMSCSLYSRSGYVLGRAVIVDYEARKVRLTVKEPQLARIGDVVCFQNLMNGNTPSNAESG
jgi:hypothetical protein